MISSSGEYITVNFTEEELWNIAERAEYLAEIEEWPLLWRKAYWQLSLVAHHLSMILEREERNTDKILEDYESG